MLTAEIAMDEMTMTEPLSCFLEVQQSTLVQMPFDVVGEIPVYEPTLIPEEPVVLESIGELNHDISTEEMHDEENKVQIKIVYPNEALK